MSDPRLVPANGRVANEALRGTVEADRYVTPTPMTVGHVTTPLRAQPHDIGAPRQKELILGETFDMLEDDGTWAFGQCARDGYVGYVVRAALVEPTVTATHVIAARQSLLIDHPRIRNADEPLPLSFGTRVEVLESVDDFASVLIPFTFDDRDAHKTTTGGYLPLAHLRPLDQHEPDPVAVAERFLGTPYHWGGDSGFGIDCSGLVQAALIACGIACPRDSDQQITLGEAATGPTRRGDLIFWKGHVAMALDEQVMIHASAHRMAVVQEGIEAAAARIAAQGDGPIIARRRITPPRG
ncbi:C40 family peptidase [Maritimibacter fusiformis]|nr:C40 family peptidase [Maritimibacter fusiformis]